MESQSNYFVQRRELDSACVIDSHGNRLHSFVSVDNNLIICQMEALYGVRATCAKSLADFSSYFVVREAFACKVTADGKGV